LTHEPTQAENVVIASLLERYKFVYVPVRLSATMLDKSIIDARTPLRSELHRAGLVDFAVMGQGRENGIEMVVPLVTSMMQDGRKVSFYRPETKQGDPRFWVERLRSVASDGALLLFAFSDSRPSVILVDTANVTGLLRHCAGALVPRYDEGAQIEGTSRVLREKLNELGGEWFRTRRAGPTGVGFTFESLLGIKANVSQQPDYHGIELKAFRRGSSVGHGKLVSLFSKTPDWQPGFSARRILDDFGYPHPKRPGKAMYCTITTARNGLAWQLRVDADASRVLGNRERQPIFSYAFGVLGARLHTKHSATLFVRASSRGEGASEEFRFEEALLCREPSFPSFLSLVEDGSVGLDLTLSEKSAGGQTRDHGYLWRIREGSLNRLYAYQRPLFGIGLGAG